MEVVAVDHRRRVQPGALDLLAHVELRLVVRHAPGDVVHRAGAAYAAREAADRAHVHERAGKSVAGGVASGRSALAHLADSERVGEDAPRERAVLHPHRYGMESVDGVLARDPGRVAPRRTRLGRGMRDELEHEPIGIAEGDHGFGLGAAPPLDRSLVRHAVPDESLEPEPERARRDGERRDRHLPRPDAAASGAGPWEEGHDAPRRAHLVTEVEVVGAGIVEVHRALDEAQPEHPGIEVEVPLRIAGDRGDVVNAVDRLHVLLGSGEVWARKLGGAISGNGAASGIRHPASGTRH